MLRRIPLSETAMLRRFVMRSAPWLFLLVLAAAVAAPAVAGPAADTPEAAPAVAGTRTGPNRLANEVSPFLKSHAEDPVDWYPWGREALERARAENKPVFLSIGYATCHWCRMMERDAFLNPGVAAILNEKYVPILVDRDERPDINRLYMAAVQAMTGRGGWPLTVVLTPDLGPFFGGTYHAAEQSRGKQGLKSILENLYNAWEGRRDEVQARGDQVREILREQVPVHDPGDTTAPTLALFDHAYDVVLYTYDDDFAGFGGTPKFPTPHKLSFLLRYADRTGNREALDMVTATLDAMAAGGIHDQLGGGFHRYSTDRQWLVPHFEKMLVDQAGLAIAYADAWRVTRNPAYRAVAEDILDYVIRDLGLPGGAFANAEDADSDRGEGTFYLWSATAIDSVLGKKDGPAFREAYNVTVGGDFNGGNILHTDSLDIGQLQEFADARARLAEARSLRPRPYRDDRVVTASNGYMIEALSRAGAAFDEPRYLDAARAAATFLIDRLWSGDRLMRYAVDGRAATPAYLDDYAYLGRGLLALYEATGEPRWLRESLRAAEAIPPLFGREEGGYSLAGRDVDTLIVPVVDIFDTAMPSGNSAAAVLFSRLGHLTGDAELEARGWKVATDFGGQIQMSPVDHLEMLYAAGFELGSKTEVVIAGDPGDPATRDMIRAVHERFLPNTVLAIRPATGGAIVSLIPYLEAQTALDGRPTAYVCRDYSCRFPVHDAEALVRELESK